LIGAIAGDIIGSAYEFHRTKHYDFQLFEVGSNYTDDTILTVAVADCLLHKKEYATTLKEYGNKYPYAGYGVRFRQWLGSKDNKPYNSFGNGSAMRVSPVGFAFSSLEEVLQEAKRSAECTHNHLEGIKGAQSVAAAIFLARIGQSKDEIKAYLQTTFGYDLDHTINEIRPRAYFDETCQVSVPQAIIAFLDSIDYEDAVRKAVSLGADADTQACITGGIAQAYYHEIPVHIIAKTRAILDIKLLEIMDEFNLKHALNI
jgi:ADP-ribosylglycohydrolase